MRISDNIKTPYNKEELYKEVLPQARRYLEDICEVLTAKETFNVK